MLTGDSNVSPTVLANLWKEEEARTKTLEEKMRVLLKDKEVGHSVWCCRDFESTFKTASLKNGQC